MRIPVATYRLQFHSGFTFEHAQNIVDYLARLGISDLYASPIFKARAGSTHGYDVVDPTQLNPELGGENKFNALIGDLQSRQIGWLQDIVPNHMAYDSQNRWLMDVLEHGPDSDSFEFFDIDWQHPYEGMHGRALAPMLGNFYGECLENGEIQLQYDQDGLSVTYYGLKLPVRIESYSSFLSYHLGGVGRSLGRNDPDFIKLLGLLYLVKNVPTETKGKERYDQISFIKGLLWELYSTNPEVKSFIETNVQIFNGEPGKPESFDLLDQLLSEQFYRLSFWKVGAEEINYRRFFTVNELISLKIEEPKVFHATHSLIKQYVDEGKFTGLRIDHIDGLYNPTEYLERLRDKMGDVYITVEKILEQEEELPVFWPVEGTSGYDFLIYVNGLFCQLDNGSAFTELYQQLTHQYKSYEELVFDKKGLIIEKNLAGDVDNLAQRLKRIAAQNRLGGDYTQYGLKEALAVILALFPVYRTYSDTELRESDRTLIQTTIAQSKERIPLLVKELDYIESVLLGHGEAQLSEEQKVQRQEFRLRMQQLTGPLMAKGVEDTLFYVYNRLISLNEVGGHPGHFGISLEQFHRFNQYRQSEWVHAMSATATHDTKRGEDARARLNVLSEMPEVWAEQVKLWSQLNQDHKQHRQRQVIPSANDEYFLYQTLIGAYPFESEELETFLTRVQDYVVKAVREAKDHTAWLRPDNDYEEGYTNFVSALLKPENNAFLEKFLPFQQQIAEYGMLNSLSQTLLKYTAPGVPDLYQGTELWDFSMVDPDNRRPVDYQQRQAFLAEIQTRVEQDTLALIRDLWTQRTSGQIKLFLVAQVLKARQAHLELFQSGDYLPLEATGELSQHLVAFARTQGDQVAIALAPRFLTNLVQPGECPVGETVWGDAQLQLPGDMPASWTNALTGQQLQGELKIATALQHFPVALLIGQR